MRSLFVVLMIAISLAAISCSSGNLQPSQGVSNAPVLLNAGDIQNDQIITFELTVNSITLNGASNVPLLPAPTPIEFVHNGAHFEPVALNVVPGGSYTGLTLSFTSASVVIVDPITHAVTPLTTVLDSSTATLQFATPLALNGAPVAINLDLDLVNSITINGSSANIAPQFTFTTAAVGAASAQDDDTGEIDNIYGRVTAFSGSTFTIQPPGTAQTFTFTANASTQFQGGLTSLSQVTPGRVVSVNAVTQADGSFLALNVEAETDTATGEVVQGNIIATAGAPVNSIAVVTQSAVATTPANAPATGTTLSVPMSTAQFSVESNNIPGALPPFGATTIGKGQNVRVVAQAEPAAPSTSLPGDKIKLQEQALTGVISSLAPSSFVLTVSNTSAFASLTGTTAIAVHTSSGTQLRSGPLSNGSTVRVRGLLFFDGSNYTLIASRVTAP